MVPFLVDCGNGSAVLRVVSVSVCDVDVLWLNRQLDFGTSVTTKDICFVLDGVRIRPQKWRPLSRGGVLDFGEDFCLVVTYSLNSGLRLTTVGYPSSC